MDMRRRAAAEFIGSSFLLAAVVGSGIMADRLAGANGALALLCNTLPTGAILVVLITMFAPISGAHFNPAVTLVFTLRRETSWRNAVIYLIAQLAGAVVGVWAAHAMFANSIFEVSHTARSGAGQWFAEGVATFGLVVAVLATGRAKPDAVPMTVGLYIVAAYWFTASTSFANPAVTIARALTESFSGIQPGDAPMFILAQLLGAICAMAVCHWLLNGVGTPAKEIP